ncbi:MAG TPA: hypothetical protein VF361_08425 [Candidatus Limnocylindrales bacterium]
MGAVSVQHEYGIWGGDDGEFVLDFVGAPTKPVVTTLHTVPQNPSTRQRAILIGLIDASTASRAKMLGWMSENNAYRMG